MEFGLFRRIVDQSASYVAEMELSYRGESLLHPLLPQMIAYARKMGIVTCLETSAAGMSEGKSVKIIEAGLDRITLWLDRSAAETGGGAQEDNIVANIEDFLRIREELGRSSPYCVIALSNTGDRFVGLSALDDVKSRLDHSGAERIVLSEPGREEPPGMGLNRDELEQVRVCFPCPYLWYSMVILCDGSITLCCRDWENANPLGSIIETRLESLWNGETMTTVRELHVRKEYGQIELCSGCNVIWKPRMSGRPKIELSRCSGILLSACRRLRSILSGARGRGKDFFSDI